MAPYGRAYAFETLGDRLFALGQLLSQKKAREEEQRRYGAERADLATDRTLRREEIDRRRAADDRARQLEDWERGAVPAGMTPAPRARAEFPSTPVPQAALDTVASDAAPNPITEMLSGARDVRPRRFQGTDPYTAGGVTYDPEVPLRRRLASESAGREATAAFERGEQAKDRLAALGQIVTALGGGEDARRRAEAIVGPRGERDPNLLLRELHPEMFRTEWYTPGATRGMPTWSQAFESVRAEFAEYKNDAYGVPQPTGRYVNPSTGQEVSFDEMRAMATEIAAGRRQLRARTPTPTPKPDGGFDIFDTSPLERSIRRRGETRQEPVAPAPRTATPTPPAAPVTETPSPADTTGFGEARARARALQAQGLSRDEIKRQLIAAGFKIE